MTEIARNILAILTYVLIAVVIAFALTGLRLHLDKAECERTGGTFYVTSTLAGCNY